MIEKFQLIVFTLQGPIFYAFLKRFYTINRKAIRDWLSFAQQIMVIPMTINLKLSSMKDDEVFYNTFLTELTNQE